MWPSLPVYRKRWMWPPFPSGQELEFLSIVRGVIAYSVLVTVYPLIGELKQQEGSSSKHRRAHATKHILSTASFDQNRRM